MQDTWKNFHPALAKSGSAGLRRGGPSFRASCRCASTSKYIGMQKAIEGELQRRGYAGSLKHHYKNPVFYVNDWDFGEAYWKHWQRLADENPEIWAIVFERILAEKADFWSDKASAEVVAQASNGYTSKVIRKGVVPGWALGFRQLPCLRDRYGVPQKPEDLFRRTPDTEALLDVEPFVDGLLDRGVDQHSAGSGGRAKHADGPCSTAGSCSSVGSGEIAARRRSREVVPASGSNAGGFVRPKMLRKSGRHFVSRNSFSPEMESGKTRPGYFGCPIRLKCPARRSFVRRWVTSSFGPEWGWRTARQRSSRSLG